MGDLLFKKIDEGINDHQSWPLSDATFRDALEIYCYRSKLHMPSNRANLFYMIIGYLSTFPYTKQFSHFGMKNIFLAINTQTIKIVVQYSHSVVGSKFQREDYKAFAIHTDPAAPKKQFYANDRKMVRKLVKKVHASFEKDKFMVAVEKVQHIAIKRPKTGAVYSILTDEGAQSFVAHRASPLVVEAESLPIINIIQPMSDTYLMLKVPPSSLEFKQLIDLRIRPYLDLFDNSYRKLFLQKNAGQGWVSSEPPMIIIASRFEDDVDYDQDESLPSDFDAQQTAGA
uniref:Uncharacterized protein n=1 Tax=Romanomermis culicivorax TaxID=13658 RepID=A0A915HTZ7_ROMCU